MPCNFFIHLEFRLYFCIHVVLDVMIRQPPPAADHNFFVVWWCGKLTKCCSAVQRVTSWIKPAFYSYISFFTWSRLCRVDRRTDGQSDRCTEIWRDRGVVEQTDREKFKHNRWTNGQVGRQTEIITNILDGRTDGWTDKDMNKTYKMDKMNRQIYIQIEMCVQANGQMYRQRYL